MDQFIIEGGHPLKGQVSVSVAKNSVLPIMCATLLSDRPIQLQKLPKLKDIVTLKKLLQSLGANIANDTFFCKELTSYQAPYDLVKTMRASILVLGPMLARFKKAVVSLPGGCAIGTRPIDIHLQGLEKLGAQFTIDGGNVTATCQQLVGADITLSFPSVGATENILMCATTAQGTTRIFNAAMEPEISDLAQFLIQMGAKISGFGTPQITIEGVNNLNGDFSYVPIADRIEAATLIVAGVLMGEDVVVHDFDPSHLTAFFEILRQCNAQFELSTNSVHIKSSPDLKSFKATTGPYPMLATDVQAQLCALALRCNGTSLITENIFENRFMHISEMRRMNANVHQEGNTAIIEGLSPLSGAPVMCTDLRASAALVLTALCARGESQVKRIYHLDRGYDSLEVKLSRLNAKIRRVRE